MHVCSSPKSKISSFSLSSWIKFRQCAERWKNICGIYANKATEIWSALELETNPNLSDDLKLHFGYHRECYQRFTDVSKLGLAERGHVSRAQQSTSQEEGMYNVHVLSVAYKHSLALYL